MKKKGFTLIELLAVIVILAIIALIAVPVIMNIISSARKSAFEDTAYGIISAGELYYAEKLLEPNGMTSDAEFTFTNGRVTPTGLNVKGSLPKSGSIVVTKEGKIAIAITNGELCITKGYDDSKIETLEEFESCDLPAKKLSELVKTNDFATSVAACATDGTTCATGTQFAIKVAPGDIKNFYVVSDVNNKVTLIMDRNIDEETLMWISGIDYNDDSSWEVCYEVGTIEEWCDPGNNNKGPITALNYLESKTSSWSNIAAKNYTLIDDQGKYTIERTNARARMLTLTEALAVGCTGDYSGNSETCPDWLYGNLKSDNPPHTFWLSSADAEMVDSAWWVNELGSVSSYLVHDDYMAGVRPVIEIAK